MDQAVTQHLPVVNIKNIFFLKGQLSSLKVHKNKNIFGSDFEFCTISLLAILKYRDFVKSGKKSKKLT